MAKRVKRSTAIRLARKVTAERKRAALAFQQPGPHGKQRKGLSND